MTDSIKNRELLPIGTRIRPAYDKLSTREGEVVDHRLGWDGGQMMVVHWDGDPSWQINYFASFEVTPLGG